VLLVMAGGIFALLVVLQDANDRIHAQDAKIGDLQREIEPVLDVARPLAREARPLVRSARGLVRPVARTAEDLSAAAEEAPQVARAVRTGIARALPLIDALQRAVPELRAVLPRAARFLDEAERRSLISRADAAVAATLHLESLQIRQLRTARQQLAIQNETLAIQKKALVHIESIDRRTGGALDGPP
jgi:ABC-type transporter Mla subunit MlaD